MRVFAIRDGEAEVLKDLAYLIYYEKAKKFYIELPEDADEWETPLLLSSFAKRGERTVNSYWSELWVRQRIVPTDRQNLGQYLRDNGLELYDEFSLLMLANGRCAQDEYYLTEIRETELPEEVLSRLSKAVEDVLPLPHFHLLIFFRDGTVRNVDAIPLLEDIRTFAPVLRDRDVFDRVTVQPGGYGIQWGETLELPKELLYRSGQEVPLTGEDFRTFVAQRIITTAEACDLLQCSRQNIDDLVRRDKLHPVKASGRTKLFLRSEVEERLWK
ncbi:MAG: helix-turn-helix domain-containing protein [Clostridia bacterium]|nr:helix-turn-helix domain-containing protein [Clostridia bacterium]MBQ8469016.1 helix-turn-helix domain-containing protein [Clostridia bacterium]